MKSEFVRFTDGIYVIVGVHLTLEETREQFGKEYYSEMNEDDGTGKIESVKHWWIRYELIGEDNCPDDWDPEPGDSMWLLYERETRPKGVTRKVTVING